jgi:hypothetical protein
MEPGRTKGEGTTQGEVPESERLQALRIGPGFLRARDNPGDRTTWENARKRLLTCAVICPWLTAVVRDLPVVCGPNAAQPGTPVPSSPDASQRSGP